MIQAGDKVETIHGLQGDVLFIEGGFVVHIRITTIGKHEGKIAVAHIENVKPVAEQLRMW